MDGEVMLPRYAEDLHIKDLESEGYETRFLRNGEFITGDKIFTEKAPDGTLYWDMLRGKEGFFGNTLGEIKEALDHYKSEGKISEDITMGIMVRRNPRTRPNDFALMSLKGFLQEAYGNSVAVNSLDVANVMEGDYDFDKADFFFSHRKICGIMFKELLSFLFRVLTLLVIWKTYLGILVWEPEKLKRINMKFQL